MSREDLDKWIDHLKSEGKVADIKIIDYNEETHEANLLIKPIKTPERIEI